MTDIDALKKTISESGMMVKAVAEQSGMLRETFYNRLKTGDFKVSEMCRLTKTLHLTPEERDRIFFADESECHSRTGTED